MLLLLLLLVVVVVVLLLSVIIIIIIFLFVIWVVYRQDNIIDKFVRKPTTLFFYLHSTYNRCLSGEVPSFARWELINYVCQLWIEHPVFVPHCWTIYNITIRFRHNRLGPFWHGSVFATTYF